MQYNYGLYVWLLAIVIVWLILDHIFFFQEPSGVLNWAISNNHNNNKPKIREIKKWLGLESYFAQQTPKPN